MNQRLFFVVFAVVTTALSTSDVFAQPGGRGRGGFGGPGGGNLGLLQREGIREEIMLSDDQAEELEQLQGDYRESMRSAMQEARENRGDRNRMREIFQERQQEVEEKLNEILLPHQTNRLQQLATQSRVQRMGAGRALESSEIREKLDLTDDQLEEIREIAREAQEELQKKVAELQKQAQQQILGSLTPGQKEQWESLLGDNFTFESRTRGRGQRGGDRQGRDRNDRGRRGRNSRGSTDE